MGGLNVLVQFYCNPKPVNATVWMLETLAKCLQNGAIPCWGWQIVHNTKLFLQKIVCRSISLFVRACFASTHQQTLVPIVMTWGDIAQLLK